MEPKENIPIRKLLSILVGSQETTAPVKLSIGYVDEDNHVHHGCIVIEECPPATLNVLKSRTEFRMEMIAGGLLVEVS